MAVGWVQIKLAAAAVNDEETAVRLGRAYGDILGRTRAEAVQRGRAADHGRWTDATLEVVSGGLHMFFHRAQAFADRRGGVGPVFWREFVCAASCRREHGGRRPHGPQTREEQRRGRDSRRHESEGGLSRTEFATSPLPELEHLAMIRWFS